MVGLKSAKESIEGWWLKGGTAAVLFLWQQPCSSAQYLLTHKNTGPSASYADNACDMQTQSYDTSAASFCAGNARHVPASCVFSQPSWNTIKKNLHPRDGRDGPSCDGQQYQIAACLHSHGSEKQHIRRIPIKRNCSDMPCAISGFRKVRKCI
jgi:hypothetical protein